MRACKENCQQASHRYRRHDPAFRRAEQLAFFKTVIVRKHGVGLVGMTHIFLNTEIGDPGIKMESAAHCNRRKIGRSMAAGANLAHRCQICIDRRDGAHGYRAAPPISAAIEIMPDILNTARIRAQQARVYMLFQNATTESSRPFRVASPMP